MNKRTNILNIFAGCLFCACLLCACDSVKSDIEGSNGYDDVIDHYENSYYMADVDKEKEEATMEADTIVSVNIGGFMDCYSEDGQRVFMIEMPIDGDAYATYTYDGVSILDKVPLSSEQVANIRQKVSEYNIRVAQDINLYWPHTEEYPAMRIIFWYDVESTEKKYDVDGACDLPPFFEEFLDELFDIISSELAENSIPGDHVVSDVDDPNICKFLNDEKTIGYVPYDEYGWINSSYCFNMTDEFLKYVFISSNSRKDLTDRFRTLQSDESIHYTPYDYNCYAKAFTVDQKEYAAICICNIKTDSGLFIIMQANENPDAEPYLCFSMPYSAEDTCVIYDNGVFVPHIRMSWCEAGEVSSDIDDIAFCLNGEGRSSECDMSKADDATPILEINEHSLSEYLQ